jgi:hypothetical protein
MGRGTKTRSLHFQNVELRARMIRETEDYLAGRLPGRDVQWVTDRSGRKPSIGQRALQWGLDRFHVTKCGTSTGLSLT